MSFDSIRDMERCYCLLSDEICADCCDDCDLDEHRLCRRHRDELECGHNACWEPPTLIGDDDDQRYVYCAEHAIKAQHEERDDYYPVWKVFDEHGPSAVAAVLNAARAWWKWKGPEDDGE